jgi:hypothetical protein
VKSRPNALSTEFEKKLLSWGFFFLLTYALTASTIVSIYGAVWAEDTPTSFGVYYLFVLILLVLISISPVRKQSWERPGRSILGALLLIVGFLAISMVLLMPHQFLWQDEYTQFIRASIPERRYFHGLVEFAAGQQQPPADFFFSAFARMLFGLTPLGIRFHSGLFTFGFYLALFLFLTVQTKHRVISFFVTLYAMSLPSLRYYLVEARPVALCLFASVFTMHFYLLSMQSDNKTNQRLFLVSAMFLPLTIGFQPEIFLIAMGLVVLAYCFFEPSKAQRYFRLFRGLCLSALLFLPFLYLIYTFGEDVEQFLDTSVVGFVDSLLTSKTHLGAGFIREHNPSPLKFPVLLVFATAILLFGFFYSRIFKSRVPLGVSFLLFLLFPAIFIVTYDFLINWNYSVRYSIIYCVPLLSFFASLATCVAEGRFKKPKLSIIIGVFLVFSLHNALQAKTKVEQLNSFKPDWATVYSKLVSELKNNPQARALYLRVFESGEGSGPYFPLHELYVPPNLRSQLLTRCPRKQCDYYVGQAMGNPDDQIFYLVFDSLGRANVYHKALSQGLEVIHDGHRVKIYAINKNGREQFISNIIDLIEGKKYARHPVFLSKVLLSFYCHTESFKKATFWLHRIQSVEERFVVNYVGQRIDVKRMVQKHLKALKAYIEKERACSFLLPRIQGV